MIGRIHSFESFGTVDGPGIRFVVFLQGCPLRCRYCHNPDTWKAGGEEYTAEEIVSRILKYKNYFGENGGVTLSGGEPLVQIDFAIELFKLLKEKGIHNIDPAVRFFPFLTIVALSIVFFEFFQRNNRMLGAGVIPFAVKVRLLPALAKVEIFKAAEFFRYRNGGVHIVPLHCLRHNIL